MINRFFRRFIPGKAESITVKVVPSDTGMLFVRLCVNDRMRAQIKCVRQSQTTILIGDILHNNEDFDYNRGYGSAMMEKLLDYARGNGITYIHGNLAERDLGHKDRLHHFYGKFGFIITEFPELQNNYYGKIELHL